MPRLPDLVRDSQLETHFLPDWNVETVHTHQELDPTSRWRQVSRSEHWQRQKKIGGGAFGTVWLETSSKGVHDIDARAVKQIEINQHSKQIDYNRELEAIAKFSHQKYERCFVKSFGWYEGPGHLFIAMEYLELGDLQHYLNHQPPLPEHEAKEITYQILDGLHFMHDNEFAHRDLKPNNILLRSCPPNEWWVKIGDFGISKRIDDSLERSTTLKGTLGYIAPELHGFAELSGPYAADIWAVGEITFRMLTKRPTFKNLMLLFNYVKVSGNLPSDQLLAAKVSQLGVEFIQSLMYPNPVDRISAKNALQHKWMDQLLSHRRNLPANRKALATSTIDSITEEFATWTTSPGPQHSFIPSKPLKVGSSLQTAGDATTTSKPMHDITSNSSDGELVASTYSDMMVGLPDCANTILSAKEQQTPIHRKSVEAASVLQTAGEKMVRFQEIPNTTSNSSDGKLVASGSIDNWDPATDATRHILEGHSGQIRSVAFSPDGKLLASGSKDGTVRLWDPATGAICHTLKGHSDIVCAVAFSPDGKLLASGSSDRTVRLWDPATGAICHTLEGYSGFVYAMAFSPDGKLLASGSSDRTVRLWDPATGAICHTLKGYSRLVYAMAFSPDGKLLASGSDDWRVRLWDPATGAICHTFGSHSDIVCAVAFSPDGKLLASGSIDGRVRLWDPATGARCHTFGSRSDIVHAVAFSPDGKLLASGSNDGTVMLWDPATGARCHTLKGHSDIVYAVAFSPDGKLLASGSNDRRVRLWDLAA